MAGRRPYPLTRMYPRWGRFSRRLSSVAGNLGFDSQLTLLSGLSTVKGDDERQENSNRPIMEES